MASLRDFDDYAAKTRGAMFAVAAAMLGGLTPETQALSRPAGVAYTVAGVLVNLPLHTARRQLYVPLELLGRHGIAPEAVFAREDGEGLRAALDDLREHARAHLAAARNALQAISPEALVAMLPAATVGAGLRRGEGADPFKPQPLSLLKRQWLLWRAARNPKRIFR